MKTKNIHHTIFTAFMAQAMCLSVVVSHMHMKDVAALSHPEALRPGSVNQTLLTSGDIHSKALGDLHHHIDKTSVKNMSTRMESFARRRELVPQSQDLEASSFGEMVYEFFLRLSVVGSMLFRSA